MKEKSKIHDSQAFLGFEMQISLYVEMKNFTPSQRNGAIDPVALAGNPAPPYNQACTVQV